jgi:hypothetical protein
MTVMNSTTSSSSVMDRGGVAKLDQFGRGVVVFEGSEVSWSLILYGLKS